MDSGVQQLIAVVKTYQIGYRLLLKYFLKKLTGVEFWYYLPTARKLKAYFKSIWKVMVIKAFQK